MTATARRLGAEDLGRRIELAGPEDELKELVDTFDGMLDQAADRKGDTGHSGLGLSIVRSVVAAHDGRATAQARAAGGVDVTVELP
jgi:K+-sensing histidine kinase KdpD